MTNEIIRQRIAQLMISSGYIFNGLNSHVDGSMEVNLNEVVRGLQFDMTKHISELNPTIHNWFGLVGSGPGTPFIVKHKLSNKSNKPEILQNINLRLAAKGATLMDEEEYLEFSDEEFKFEMDANVGVTTEQYTFDGQMSQQVVEEVYKLILEEEKFYSMADDLSHFVWDSAAVAEFADASWRIACATGMDINEWKFVFIAQLRMVKSDSQWAK